MLTGRRLLARGLRGRPVRTLLTTLGVTLCALLTVVLFAAQGSLARAVRTYPGAARADLWIAPRGTDNLIRSASLLPAGLEAEVRTLAGVAADDPLLRTFLTFETETGDRKATLLAIGYRLPDGVGGPPPLRERRPPAHWDEVVLDRAAADRLGVAPGDLLFANGFLVTVTGLTDGTNLLATQLAFGDIRAAARATGLQDRASLLAVRVRPGVDREGLRRELQSRFDATSVLTTEEFVASNLREVSAGVRPLLALLVVLGLLVAGVLVALLTQGLVEERREDLAVLLALGGSPAALALTLLRSVAGLVAAGAAIGATLALLLAIVLDRWAPAVELAPRPADALLTVLLFLAAGMTGAAAPVVRLRGVDPLEAFRS